jgi:hypothetical protein
MIQAYTDDRMIVGITRKNVERLTDGKPLVIRPIAHRRVTEILVLFGEDKPAILRQLEAAGMDIAEAWKASAESDPL